MTFVLRVIGGSDEGKLYRVDPGETLIGRSPSAKIQLKDDSVAWEHARIESREGKLHLSNLSALGTRVRGRRVDEMTRLRPRDEVQLSSDCRLLIEERAGRGTTTTPPWMTWVLAGVVLFAVVGGGLFALLSSGAPPPRPVTGRHWRTAYGRLSERLDRWAGRG